MSLDNFIEIGKIHAKQFMNDEDTYRDFLNTSESGLNMMVAVYERMVGLGQMERIERLERQYKEEIYADAKEWSKDQTKETLIKFSKALWALRQLIYLIQNK